jgi:glyoxylase-like metal-dependent hydrolase (beta-lactamase superfamily II)
LPIIEAGKAQLVASDYALDDEVLLEPTPGHTPDHVSIRLASQGQQGVITGDMIHNPVQCLEPGWIMRADFEPDRAVTTRKQFLEQYCDSGVVVCATHFPEPSIGHIVPRADSFGFAYEE